MKTIILAAVLAALAIPAWAGLPLGRGEITANVTATVSHDSNVFGTPDPTADWSGLLAPRVTYLRKAGQVEAEASAGISIFRYLEQTQLNSENLDASAVLRITEDSSRHYSGFLSAVYRESSELNSDLNARLNLKSTIFSTQSTLITGPRTKATLSGTYTDTLRAGGGDQQVLTTEALYDYRDFFYGNSLRLTGTYDELDNSGGNTLGVPLKRNSYMASAGLGRTFYHDVFSGFVSYGHRVLNRSAAEALPEDRRQSGYVFSATVQGPFLPKTYFPKVTSLLALSYQDSATPGIYDAATRQLTGRLTLVWQAREHTSVSFSAYRTQRLAVNALTVVTTSVVLGLEKTLRFNLTGTLGAGYDWSDYRGTSRQDRTTTLSAGLRYNFARAWVARLSTNLTSTSSTNAASTYDRLITSLSVSREF